VPQPKQKIKMPCWKVNEWHSPCLIYDEGFCEIPGIITSCKVVGKSFKKPCKKVVCSDVNTSSVDKPSVHLDKPSVDVDTPTVDVDKPSVDVDKPTLDVDKPSVDVNTLPVPSLDTSSVSSLDTSSVPFLDMSSTPLSVDVPLEVPVVKTKPVLAQPKLVQAPPALAEEKSGVPFIIGKSLGVLSSLSSTTFSPPTTVEALKKSLDALAALSASLSTSTPATSEAQDKNEAATPDLTDDVKSKMMDVNLTVICILIASMLLLLSILLIVCLVIGCP
jgi:hypothetical protein